MADVNNKYQLIFKALIYGLFFTLLFIYYPTFTLADVQQEIESRNKQIEELQRQIDIYQKQIDESRTQSNTLENEIRSLNARISSVQLEIKSLGLSINQTADEIGDTEVKIDDAESKISKHKNALAQYIKIAYENDQRSLTEILLKNDSLSDFFNDLNSVQATQDNLKTAIDDIKHLKGQLEQHQNNLEEKQNELERLKGLQELENRSLTQNKGEKNKLLKDTKGQESRYQELVKQSQKDIQRIRDQIGYLIQNGVSVEDAIKYGQLAAIATDIRPAFLIAELEIESGIGINVGKCNRADDPPERGWRNIMNPRDFKPFAAITSQLGLNIDNTPVSCPQYARGKRYGWGGAMGPAQFIPSTWLGYAEEVTRLVRRSIANPWNIEDAFTAAAIKLAKIGATSKTRAGEVAASKAYYSGKSNCSTAPCNNYANAVQRKAAEIEKSL